MTMKTIQLSIAALALAFSGAASATTDLNGQYKVSSFANQIDTNEYTFTYLVKNLNQTTGAGSQTGLDGFTIFVPDSAILVTSSAPPNNGAGHWTIGSGSTLASGGGKYGMSAGMLSNLVPKATGRLPSGQ